MIKEDGVMRLSSNIFALSAYKYTKLAQDQLSVNMRRLSSGKQMLRPGDNPSRYAIANTLRASIKRSEKALENIQQVRTMMQTADSYLGTVESVITRMAELTVSSFDATKNQADKLVIRQEFDALKDDISNISRRMKINGVDFLSRQQILSYDDDEKKFFFSQVDGSEKYYVDKVVSSGVNADNGIDFLFSANNQFTLSHDGKNIYYVDNQSQLTRFDIERYEIVRDTTASAVKGMNVDEQGRLWYASELSSGVYGLRQQDLGLWQKDSNWIQDDSINDMGSSEFSVYEDRVYYVNTSGNVISRDLKNLSDERMEVQADSLSPDLKVTDRQFSIGEDGLYVADVPSDGTIRLTHTLTGNFAEYSLPSGMAVTDLQISRDNHEIFFIDDSTGSIMSLGIDQNLDYPRLNALTTVHNVTTGSGFTGLSLDGGSNRGNIVIQQGPDKGQYSEVVLGDVSVYNLGLTRVSLDDEGLARGAHQALMDALDRVFLQRAKLGVKESSLSFTTDSLSFYKDSISESYKSIHNVDMAKESSDFMANQLKLQTTTALLAQANAIPRSTLSLLSR